MIKCEFIFNKNSNIFFSLGLWQNCIASGCTSKNGGRPAALAIAV